MRQSKYQCDMCGLHTSNKHDMFNHSCFEDKVSVWSDVSHRWEKLSERLFQ